MSANFACDESTFLSLAKAPKKLFSLVNHATRALVIIPETKLKLLNFLAILPQNLSRLAAVTFLHTQTQTELKFVVAKN